MRSCLSPAIWFQVSVEELFMTLAHHGRSHLLLYREKQRTAEEGQKKDLEEKKQQKETIDNLAKEVEQLKNQLRESEFDRCEADYNRCLLEKLYDNNVIDREGKPLPFQPGDEFDPNAMN